MSDQEKKSGGNAIDSSVVMVEKTTGIHKQPYRPTELQDDTDLHHKLTKAPVVPSVVEELKNVVEGSANENIDIEARTEYGHAISSEKHKHSVAKKLSSSTKKREPSPESIALKSLDVDKKKTPLEPIPLQQFTDIAGADKDFKKADDDSITEEIADLRSPEEAKEHSEWNSNPTKKKEISWNDREYQENVVLQEIGARSEAWMLDRKASVGPCFRPGMPFEGPSGIMICLPKRSMKCINQPSGININIIGKSMETKSKMTVTDVKKSKSDKMNIQINKLEKVDSVGSPSRVDNIKQKLDNIHLKIRSILHI